MNLLTGNQLIAHLVGDYFLQSDWMATTKKDKIWPCAAHAVLYVLPFLFLTHSWKALVVISATHFIIDHWKLPSVFGWLKNFLAPKSAWVPWSKSFLGFAPDRPVWLVVWLVIIIDNTLHLIINGLCLYYL